MTFPARNTSGESVGRPADEAAGQAGPLAGRTALLLLGMHRSGTSATTRVLSLAGAGLPAEMIGPGEGNPRGHWESRRIAVFNDELLAELGRDWSDWRPLDLGRLSPGRSEEIGERIRALVAEEFGQSGLIVLKDPRICRLVPLYRQALEGAGYRVQPVLVFRKPSEVILSLRSRSSWPGERGDLQAALLWLVHVLEAERATRGQGRIFWSFDDLMTDWKGFLSRLSTEAEVAFPVAPSTIEAEVASFLEPGEKRQNSGTPDLVAHGIALPWLRDAHAALLRLAAEPGDPAAQASLDRIAQEIGSAEAVLRLAQAELAGEHAARVESERELESELAAQEERLREVRALLAEREGELQALRVAHEELARAAAATEAHLAEVGRHRDLLIAEIEEAHRVYTTSSSWRVTAPLRLAGSSLRALRSLGGLGRLEMQSLRRLATIRGGLAPTAKAATAILLREGPRGLAMRFRAFHKARFSPPPIEHDFSERRDFVNWAARARKDVLLSEWHVGVVRALADRSPPDRAGPTLGISLVTYNSAGWLPGFFASLEGQDFPLSRLNLIFVDNGSSDDTRALLSRFERERGARFASVQVHHRKNEGFGAGHDFAIRRSSDEFVLVSNVDLEFRRDTLSRLLRAAMADAADVGCWEVRQCPYEHPKYYDPVTLEAPWASHACVLLRRSAYERVGGYERRIFMYGEDVELSYRLRGNGFRLRYLPQVAVTHFVDLTDASLRPQQLTGSLSANVLLRHRYGGAAAGAEGEALLAAAMQAESEPARVKAFAAAAERIERDRDHFAAVHRPAMEAPFPFSGFDYAMRRDGHDVALESGDLPEPPPKVTVVTRTHGPKIGILGEAMASVLNQSYPNIEHIVVEDRTDFARGLVEEAAAAYGRDIRYLKSPGEGRSSAGNFGLASARGDYMMFLDNDDLLFGDHVELLLRALHGQDRHAAAFALGWMVETEFGEDGSYVERAHGTPELHRVGFDRERLLNMNFMPIQCVLFRRRVYEAEGGFDETIDHLEDWNLWARYALHGDFVYVPKLTSMYRIPADAEVRASRQGVLDDAYQAVRARILDRYGLSQPKSSTSPGDPVDQRQRGITVGHLP